MRLFHDNPGDTNTKISPAKRINATPFQTPIWVHLWLRLTSTHGMFNGTSVCVTEKSKAIAKAAFSEVYYLRLESSDRSGWIFQYVVIFLRALTVCLRVGWCLCECHKLLLWSQLSYTHSLYCWVCSWFTMKRRKFKSTRANELCFRSNHFIINIYFQFTIIKC